MNPTRKSTCCEHCQDEVISSQFQQTNSDLERLQLEEALHKNQAELEEYRALYESLPSLYFTLDLEGVVMRVNQFGAARLGYTTEELIAHPVFYVFHPEDHARLQAEFACFLQHPTQRVQQEFRQVCKDGRILWVKISGCIAQETFLNPIILLLCEDITERKQTEEELTQYRHHLEELVKERTSELVRANEQLQQEIAERKQAEERLAKINECFLSFGTNPAKNINNLTALCGELVGASCALYSRIEQGMLCSVGQWHTPSDFNPVDKPDGHICWDVIKEGSDELFVLRDLPYTPYAQTDPNVMPYHLQTYIGQAVRCQDTYIGSLCAVYQKDFVPREADKKLISIIAQSIRLEEERSHLEKTLCSTQDFLTKLLDNAPAPIYITTADNRYRLVNRAWEEFVGLHREEVIGHSLQEVLPPAVAQHFMEGNQRVIDTGDSIITEEFADAADGRHCFYTVKFPMHNAVGQIEAVGGISLDITERKRAEETLSKSHSLLCTVIESTPDGVLVKDIEGRYVMLNSADAQVLGKPIEELIGKNDAELWPPETARQLREKDLKIMTTGVAETFEEVVVINNGLQQTKLTTKSPWRDKEGNIIGLIGIARDITKRKQAEEALRQQFLREQLVGATLGRIHQSLNLEDILNTTVAEVRQFLASDRVLIYRVWPNGTGSAVTEAVLPGWPAILGETFPEEVFPQESQQLYCQGRTLAIADVDQAEVLPCLAKFVKKFGVKAKLVVPILQDEALWGLLIAHQCSGPRQWQPLEIDLLKQLATQVAIAIQQSELFRQVQRLNLDLERQVRARTAQLELAFEFEATLKRVTDRVRDSLDESQIWQTAVQELGTVVGVKGCNAALYDLDQGISTIYYEYTTSVAPSKGREAQMADFPEIYGQLLQGQCIQFCSIFPNPVRGHVAMLACPIFDDQGVLGDLWLINHKYYAFQEQDIRLVQQVANQCAIAIRQARLYQEAQAQVEELERLHRLKDDFLSTVSHELRSPMANIRMAIQMLEVVMDWDGKFSSTTPSKAKVSKVARYFQILNDECEREISLINDLLDLQRLDAGNQPLDLTIIHFQDWIPHVVEPFEQRAQNQQQILQVDVSDDLPPLVSDTFSLGRILAELLNNACKYTPPAKRITLTARASAQMILLSVSNSGVEIPEGELSHVFEKFYRIPSSDPWKQGGTGLGLALVKKLTEHLGGRIWVESASGQTCFTVELPIDLEASATLQK